MTSSRYTSVFNETQRIWQVKDRETGNAFGRFDTRRQSDRRATELQMRHNQKLRENYGMSHPQPAPAPRAFRED
jgi:hypothetical protein